MFTLRKKSNRGFTLIELIVSITILTIVISIGYRIINNSNIMFSTQLGITNQQVSANDLNKFLSRDIQYSVNIEGPIFSKYKSDGSEYTLYNIENNEEVDYEYNITTNENEEISYIVSIKDCKYSISRVDSNGVLLDFIYNENLVEDGDNLKAPLVIKQSSENESLYYVNLKSVNKKNNNEYRFQVASRYQLGSMNGDNGLGNVGGNGGGSGNTDESEGIISNKNLIFEYKKLDKHSYDENYEWQYKVKFKLDEYTDDKSSNKANGVLFSDQFVIRRYGEEIEAVTSHSYNPGIKYTNPKVKQIKGFILKFEDDMEIKGVTFMNKNYGDLNESNKKYTFNLTGNMQNIEWGNLLTGTVKINDNSNKDGVYRIEIEFIY